MTVRDIEFSEHARIFLHAPNKPEDWIEVDNRSTLLLKSLIEYGVGLKEFKHRATFCTAVSNTNTARVTSTEHRTLQSASEVLSSISD